MAIPSNFVQYCDSRKSCMILHDHEYLTPPAHIYHTTHFLPSLAVQHSCMLDSIRCPRSQIQDPRLYTLGINCLSIMCSPCRATGLRGSAALLLASLLQLDAFGNIHWDSHDLMVGLALGSPVVLLGTHSRGKLAHI